MDLMGSVAPDKKLVFWTIVAASWFVYAYISHFRGRSPASVLGEEFKRAFLVLCASLALVGRGFLLMISATIDLAVVGAWIHALVAISILALVGLDYATFDDPQDFTRRADAAKTFLSHAEESGMAIAIWALSGFFVRATFMAVVDTLSKTTPNAPKNDK